MSSGEVHLHFSRGWLTRPRCYLSGLPEVEAGSAANYQLVAGSTYVHLGRHDSPRIALGKYIQSVSANLQIDLKVALKRVVTRVEWLCNQVSVGATHTRI